MDARIIDEEDDWIGVGVTDNGGASHKIAVNKSGGIRGHSQDGYPDIGVERTDREDEHVSQARRYAKWYLYTERGYEAMEPWNNHDRIASVGVAILGSTDAQLRQFFGDTFDQIRCHYRDDIDSTVSLPEGHEDGSDLFYTQDVALTEPFEQRLTDFTEVLGEEAVAATRGLSTSSLVDAFFEAFGELPGFTSKFDNFSEGTDLDLDKIAEIRLVSGLNITYIDDHNIERTVRSDNQIEEPVDARLELPPNDFDTLEQFRAFLVLHLVCQLRDLFIGMGVEPPEAYRYLGPGKTLFTGKYEDFDFYEPYHDTQADIEGYTSPG